MTPEEALFSLLGFQGPQPPILYHYTSMAGLLSILETGRIRASHVRYLNDRSELAAIWEAVIKQLEMRRDSANTTEESAYLCRIIELATSKQLGNEFVASFSENGDDLSQWRSYCPGGAGFSIGFATEALRSQWVSDAAGGKPSFVGGQLLKVRYLDEKAIVHLDSFIDAALQLASQLNGMPGVSGQPISKEQVVPAWFSVFAPAYKHAAFRHECEWRMVLTKPHKPMPGQRFREGKSTMIPYVEVELNRNTEFKLSDKYMVQKVVIGPTPNVELSLEALRSLFASKGHPEVSVEASSIPYRDW